MVDFYGINVGTYTSPMDPMGKDVNKQILYFARMQGFEFLTHEVYVQFSLQFQWLRL